jgi:hypothetical protein
MRISDWLVAQCWPSASNPHLTSSTQATKSPDGRRNTIRRLRAPPVVHLASKHINTRVIPLPVRPTGHLTVLESQSPKELGLDLGSSKGCERPRGSVDHLSDPHPPYSSKGGPQGLPGPGRGIGVQTVSTISRLALFRYQRQGVCENLPLYQMGCWARGVCPGG